MKCDIPSPYKQQYAFWITLLHPPFSRVVYVFSGWPPLNVFQIEFLKE